MPHQPCLKAVALCGLALPLALGTPRAAAQEFYDNVVIVLDASGSMNQKMRDRRTVKMDAAKQAIQAVLKTVPQSTRVGLLVFSAANLKTDWVYPLGPRNDAVLFQALSRIRPGSKTPLGAYIKKGADRLLQERAAQYGYGTYRLLIVTDGEASDRALVERYTPEVMARGITMDVIGVAMSRTHTLATKVHSYRRADDPASLQRAIREVFAEVGSAAAATAQTEAFEVVAPIPVEVASAMIQALATSGNQPIGAKPNARPAPPTRQPPRPAATSAQPSKNVRQPATQTQRTTTRPHSSVRTGALTVVVGILIGLGVLFIGAVVIVVFIVKAVRRRQR